MRSVGRFIAGRSRLCSRIKGRARVEELNLKATLIAPHGHDHMIDTGDRGAVLKSVGGELRNTQSRAKHHALVRAPARADLFQPVVDGGNVVAAHAEGARLDLAWHVR